MFSQSKLTNLYSALTSIEGLKVYHYFAPSSKAVPYCVWYEDAESSSLEADDHKAEQAVSGYVDYYTKTEFDPMFDAIQNALNGIENCAWTFESTIYGDPSSEDNNTIHYTWSWRLA